MNTNDIIIINNHQEVSEFIIPGNKYEYFLAEKRGNKIIIRKQINSIPQTNFFFKLNKYTFNKFDFNNCKYLDEETSSNKEIAYFIPETKIQEKQIFNIKINPPLIDKIKNEFIDFVGLYNKKDYLNKEISDNYEFLDLTNNIFYYDKKYLDKDNIVIKCNELWYGEDFMNIGKKTHVNMIMIIFKKYKLCVISIYLDTVKNKYGKNILLNIKELENKIKEHPKKEEIIGVLRDCNIIVMGNIDDNIDDAIYIFSGLSIPRKIYKRPNYSTPLVFIMSTNAPPICSNIYGYNTIDTSIEYQDKLVQRKNVAFDCDGVLHTFVGPRGSDPIKGNHLKDGGPMEVYRFRLSDDDKVKLFSENSQILNYPFVRIITKLIDYHFGNNKIYIITSQPHFYDESYDGRIEVKYIEKLKNDYFPFIDIDIVYNYNFLDGDLYKDKSFVEKYKKLNDFNINIYYEDSCKHISLILKKKNQYLEELEELEELEGLNELEELYITNPYDTIRTFSNIILEPFTYKNIIDNEQLCLGDNEKKFMYLDNISLQKNYLNLENLEDPSLLEKVKVYKMKKNVFDYIFGDTINILNYNIDFKVGKETTADIIISLLERNIFNIICIQEQFLERYDNSFESDKIHSYILPVYEDNQVIKYIRKINSNYARIIFPTEQYKYHDKIPNKNHQNTFINLIIYDILYILYNQFCEGRPYTILLLRHKKSNKLIILCNIHYVTAYSACGEGFSDCDYRTKTNNTLDEQLNFSINYLITFVKEKDIDIFEQNKEHTLTYIIAGDTNFQFGKFNYFQYINQDRNDNYNITNLQITDEDNEILYTLDDTYIRNLFSSKFLNFRLDLNINSNNIVLDGINFKEFGLLYNYHLNWENFKRIFKFEVNENITTKLNQQDVKDYVNKYIYNLSKQGENLTYNSLNLSNEKINNFIVPPLNSPTPIESYSFYSSDLFSLKPSENITKSLIEKHKIPNPISDHLPIGGYVDTFFNINAQIYMEDDDSNLYQIIEDYAPSGTWTDKKNMYLQNNNIYLINKLDDDEDRENLRLLIVEN